MMTATMGQSDLKTKRAQFETQALPFLNEIYASALKMARNPQKAEDLAAVTFENAWRAFDSFRQGTNIRAWLYRIMTNAHINEFRKIKRTPDTVSVDSYEEPDEFYVFNKIGAEAATDAARSVERFTEHDINKAIGKLPEEFRTTFVLTEVQGFTYEETAKMTRVPIGTVRSRLSRARKHLQRHLWEYSQESGVTS